MKIAVCVKYVPVVARITFDYEKKTIIREGTPSEINAFDRLGLTRAVELKSSPADEVVAVSMGPPQAREGLVECLALGADRAVLLTDRGPALRREAAWSLGRLGDRRAAPALIAALDDSDLDVRWFAKWALERIGRGLPETAPGAASDAEAPVD